MADAMGLCQQYNDDAVADALRNRAATPRAAGLAACERLDCGEPIHPHRTALGARLCMECQQVDELEASRYRRGSAR